MSDGLTATTGRCGWHFADKLVSRPRGPVHFSPQVPCKPCAVFCPVSLDPTGKGQARWTMRWKTALNAFDITFGGRLAAARQ